eukprot:141211-Pleurochrysis_carterae.AAC.1
MPTKDLRARGTARAPNAVCAPTHVSGVAPSPPRLDCFAPYTSAELLKRLCTHRQADANADRFPEHAFWRSSRVASWNRACRRAQAWRHARA